MKKFYALVTKAPVPGGFSICLDGKPVKTPSGGLLLCPAEALADAIAAEWAGQAQDIIPDSMPLTQLLTTAQDQAAGNRAAMTEKLAAYLDTDLLCYRAALPEALAALQAEKWDPLLSWFAEKHGARLETTTGLAALRAPQKAHASARAAIDAMTLYEFTVLQLAVPLTGSLILGLAFIAGDADAAQLYEAATIEESYKAVLYNEAEHGAAPMQEKKFAAMRRDLEAGGKFLALNPPALMDGGNAEA